MSDLPADLLTPGVRRWASTADPGADLDSVRRAAGAAGWRAAYVDAGAGATKAGFLAAMARELGLPAWFGGNLDALADALRDLEGPGTLLLWDGWEALAADDPAAYAGLLAVLGERAAGPGPALAVLLHEAAADPDVPFPQP